LKRRKKGVSRKTCKEKRFWGVKTGTLRGEGVKKKRGKSTYTGGNMERGRRETWAGIRWDRTG